ncbi:MAG: metallophosphoesterase [Deltaproteobacteria bacterium]|nr:metallophosphoesterase [Deltaproteobacteria bacterium]
MTSARLPGANAIVFADSGRHPLVVQALGFAAQELGEAEIRRCLDSIAAFSDSGSTAARYLVIHNREGQNAELRERVGAALQGLVDDGAALDAQLWHRQILVDEVGNALAEMVREQLEDLAQSTAHSLSESAGAIARVPLVRETLEVDAHRLKSTHGRRELVGDPALELAQAGDAPVCLVLGGFGFGKTTAIARRILQKDWMPAVILGAAIGKEVIGTKGLLELLPVRDAVLELLPEDDRNSIGPLLRPVIEYVLKNPNFETVLVVDGLDESAYLSRRGGLQQFFNSVRGLGVPVLASVRTERWNTSRGDFDAAFGTISPTRKSGSRQIEVIELVDWGPDQMVALVQTRARREAVSPWQQSRLGELAELFEGGGYEKYFSDIPRRPLFLDMIIDNALEEDRTGLRETRRAELVREWATNKLRRDFQNPLGTPGAASTGRAPIVAGVEDSSSAVSAAWQLMREAAVLMTSAAEGELILEGSCAFEDLQRARPELTSADALVTNSLLEPVGPRRHPADSLRLRFSHRMFQEFFLGEALARGEPRLRGLRISTEIRVWEEQIRDDLRNLGARVAEPPKSLTILHISDPQFGRRHRFGKAAPGPDAGWDSLSARLRTDLEGLLAPERQSIDLIVVTGDLTETGRASEFSEFRSFIDDLRNSLRLDRSRVLVVPGNHDVNRALCQAYFSKCEGEEVPPEPPYWPKWGPYAEFFRKFHGERYSFSESRPYTHFELPELSLVVAGLNTTMAHGTTDHPGFVGEDQARWFAQRLKEARERRQFRLVLMHHDRDDTDASDFKETRRHLTSEVNLVLHGHTHLGSTDWWDSAVPVLATGSAGVNASALPPEGPNQYQVLSITDGGFVRRGRMYLVDEKRFERDPRIEETFKPVTWNECPFTPQPQPPSAQARQRSESITTVSPSLTEDVGTAPDTATKRLIRAAFDHIDDQPEIARASFASILELSLTPRERASTTLGLALALLSLQDVASATKRLEAVDAAALAPGMRPALVRALLAIEALDRARSLLASYPSPEMALAHTHLAILEGQLPGTPAGSPELELLVARQLHNQGRFRESVARALPLANDLHNRTEKVECLDLLIGALLGTIFDLPSDSSSIPDPITVGDRQAVIDACESLIGALKSEELVGALVPTYNELKRRFSWLTMDPDHALDARSRSGEASSNDDPPLLVAGDSLPAPSESAPIEHPESSSLQQNGGREAGGFDLLERGPTWFRQLNNLLGSRASKDRDGFADGALALANAFEGKVPLDHTAAQALLWVGRAADALPLARRAFANLPARGMRLLLGQILANVEGHEDEAWQVLEPLAAVSLPATMYLLALVCARYNPALSVPYWRRYLQTKAGHADSTAHLQFAGVLLQVGPRHDEAFQFLEGVLRRAETVPSREIVAAAQLLRLAGPDHPVRKHLTDVALAVLDARSDSDDEARRGSFALRLDRQVLTAADIGRALIDDVLRPVSRSQFETLLEITAQLTHSAFDAYGRGEIGAHVLARSLGSCVVVFENLREGRARLQTPAVYPPSGVLSPEGELLIGALELHLLHSLEVLPQLEQLLSPSRPLVLFRDEYQQVITDVESTESRRDRFGLARTEDLLAWIDGSAAQGKVELLSRKEVSARGFREPPRGAIVRHLIRSGELDGAAAQRLAPSGRRREDSDVAVDTIVLGPAVLQWLQQDRLLDAVARIARVIVPSESHESLGRLRALLRACDRRADVAMSLHRWVARGLDAKWLALDTRPVPALAARAGPVAKEICDRLAEAFAYYEWLIAEPQRQWVCADFFAWSVFAGGAPIRQIAAAIDWTRDEYLQQAKRYRAVAERKVCIPTLLDNLPTLNQEQLREQLVELGFEDALRPSDLLHLNRKWTNLDLPEPSRRLERVEVRARDRIHPGGFVVAMTLTETYARAFRDAWVAGPEEEAKRLSHVILRRMQTIETMRAERLAPMFFDDVLAGLVSQPHVVFKEDANRLAQLDTDGPIARMWQFLREWSGSLGPRRAAYARALQSLLCFLDEQAEREPNPIGYAPLFLAVTATDPRSSDDDGRRKMLEPEVAAFAILSANWETRPLADVSFAIDDQPWDLERALNECATVLATDPARSIRWQDEAVRADVRHRRDAPTRREAVARFWAPPEALLLRLPPSLDAETRGRLWFGYARLIGVHDGELYALATRLAEHDDPELRHEFARRATSAPFRQVRADPLRITEWGRPRKDLAPRQVRTLDDLRQILSEPPGLLPEDSDLSRVIIERLETGVWSERIDQELLIEDVSRVPGSLAAGPLDVWLQDDAIEDRVHSALGWLRTPAEQPCARLYQAIIFLRAAAAKRPLVRTPRGTIDLRSVLPGLLAGALESVPGALESVPGSTRLTSPSSDVVALQASSEAAHGSLGDAEPGLLRLCAQVVERLALPEVLPDRDRLWLTWRLWAWLARQLDALDASARAAAVEELTRSAPAARLGAGARLDLLDPLLFAPTRIDIRAMSVLAAVSGMDEAAGTVGLTPLESVSSEPLLDLLAKLAERDGTEEEWVLLAQPTRSSLAWDDEPTVPRLAMRALLGLDHTALGRLSPKARLVWFLGIPAERSGILAPRLAIGAAAITNVLSADERLALASLLRLELPIHDDFWWVPTLCWVAAVKGPEIEFDPQDLDLVASRLRAHVDSPFTPDLYSRFLSALSFRDPLGVASRAEALLDELSALGANPLKLLTAVARVLFGGAPEAADSIRALVVRRIIPLAGSDPAAAELASIFGVG